MFRFNLRPYPAYLRLLGVRVCRHKGLRGDWAVKTDPPADEFKLPDKPELSLPIKAGNRSVVLPTSLGSRFVLLTQQDKPAEDAHIVYDLQAMKEVGRIAGRLTLVDLVVSPDGAYVAGRVLGSPKPAVEVYSVATGKSLNKIEVDAKPGLLRLADFAAGDQIITAKMDGLKVTYRTWDIKTGKQGVEFQSSSFVDDKTEAFSPGRKYMAITDDGKVVVYDLSSGKPAGDVTLPKSNDSGKYSCQGMTFSADGKSLAGLFHASDSRVLSWDVATGKAGADHTITGNLQQLAQNAFGYMGGPFEWLPDQSGWLAYGQLLIDAQSGKVAWKVPVEGNDNSPRRFLDKDHLLTVTGELRQKKLVLQTAPRKEIDAAIETVRSGKDPSASQLPAMKTADWSNVKTVPIPGGSVEWKAKIEPAAKPAKALAARPLTLQGKAADIASVLFSSGDVGQAAVITTAFGNLTTKKLVHVDRYDLAEGKVLGGTDLFVTEPPQGRAFNIDANLSADGTALIVKEPREGKRVDVWSVDQGKHVAGWLPFEKEADPVVSWLAFIDSKRALTANAAGKMVLWSLPDCQAIYTTSGCKGAVTLSPDRKYLAAYNGATYDLIETATGERRGQLALPSATSVQQVEGAAFRPDGKALAAILRRSDSGILLAQWELKGDAAPSSFVMRQPSRDVLWCGNDHILVGPTLVDFKLKLPLATYVATSGKVMSETPDGRCWFRQARGANDPVLLAPQTLPDVSARKLASDIADKTAQPVYLPGMNIKVNVEGATPASDGDAFRKKMVERLTAHFEQSGLKVADKADLTLTASVQPEHETGDKIEIREIGGIPKKVTVADKEVEIRWALTDGKGTTLFEQKTSGRMQGFGIIPGSADPTAYLNKTMWDSASASLPALPAGMVRLGGKVEQLPRVIMLTGD